MPARDSQSPVSPHITEVFHQASHDGRQLVEGLLRQQSESLDWIDDLRNLQAKFLNQSPQQAQRDCSAGCPACCMTAQVDATPIEAIAVSEYLKAYLDADALFAVKNRLTRVTKLRIAQQNAQAPQRPLACGMLGTDGKCMVYPVRPVICSGVFSLNQNECFKAEREANAGDFSQSIPLDKFALQATGGISGSLQRVLVEHGLDGNLYELSSAVLVALQVPDCLTHYLNQEDIFKNAICTDPHSPPRKRIVPAPKFLNRRVPRPA
ncbi:hypothetical protein DTL42_04240 [Bremerella cremea]|uniref:YkgJ family cysteine cluster protein n=1 Tax=Bremerella cremea TaxID=1031537 RepID=A0A368KYJ5_9BACT|nr:YkgJ family cysteine cluster protein [Bremerella cremea]RCS54362.1 hypothetical protein DTL42_04240 [Bremerella cremea]